MASAGATAASTSVLSARYRWISIGTCLLIALSAFESLAITTVMPVISRDLHGATLYAMAFAGPLAVSVVGMVAGGNWADRRGPKPALYTSVAVFVIGLLVTGTSLNMGIFLCGRVLQGLGSGGLTVALYVIVARVYPAALQPKIFAGFAAAWVVPSLVGPFIAGIVAERLSWHWVFLGVACLVGPTMAMVVPVLRRMTHDPGDQPLVRWNARRIGWASVIAVAVLGLNLSAQLTGVLAGFVPVLAVAVALAALRPLLPKRTLRAAGGLPSVILVRGLVSATYFGAEVYVPYLLIREYHLTPSLAGLALTTGSVAWACGSWVQGRYSRLGSRASIRLGAAFVLVAVLLMLLTTVLGLPAAVAICGWTLAGAGMGLMYPRLSVLMLAYSTARNQGFNSSALSIADSTGAAISLAFTAIVFAGLAPFGVLWSFAGCFALVVITGTVALLAGGRVVPVAELALRRSRRGGRGLVSSR